MDDIFKDAEIISSYSRKQAIEDGVLVDVSATDEAKESGFRFPIALTREVWDSCVAVPEGVHGQDEKGRLWDILWMFKLAIRKAANGTDTVYFRLHVRNDNRESQVPLVTLKAVCGPGDDAAPVITIMQPNQD